MIRVSSTILACCILSVAVATAGYAQGPTAPLSKKTAFEVAANASSSSALSLAGAASTDDFGSGSGADGLIGVRHSFSDGSYFSVFYNRGAATTVTGSENTFGTSVREPGTAGGGLFIEGFYNWRRLKPYSLYYRGGFTNVAWQDSDTSVDGSVLYGSIGIQRAYNVQLIKNDPNNAIQLGYIIAATMRGFGGDIGQHPKDRSELLGTSQSFFIGPEITVFLRMNSVQPYARVSFIGGPTASGLTDIQTFIGVNVIGDMFTLPK